MLHQLQFLFESLDFAAMGNALLRVLAIFLCLTVHEASHGLAAYVLGDPTAKAQHRLSLNPLRHIDWFGLLMMFTVGFGWAKGRAGESPVFPQAQAGNGGHRSGRAGVQPADGGRGGGNQPPD